MKTITKKYLESELEGMITSAEQIKAFAAMSPFGNAIDLEAVAEAHLAKAEERVRVAIWQKHRIAVLKGLLEQLS